MDASQTIRLGAEIFSQSHGVNVAAVRNDLKRPFRILFCGDPAYIAELRSAFLCVEEGQIVSDDAAGMLETILPQNHETLAGEDIKLIIFLGRAGDEHAPLSQLQHFHAPVLALYVDPNVSATTNWSMPVSGGVERIKLASLEPDQLRISALPFIAEALKSVAVAAGRRYVLLREAICTILTRDTARLALKISAGSAIVDQVPLLGFIIGRVASAGDIVAISAMQMNLTLRIGSVYMRDPDLGSVWEMLPVIGGGLGWRALSRELSGFIPIAGLAIKAAIAYAGTIVVGEGAAFYYRTGRHMSKSQAGELYAETKRAAIDIARDMIARLRS
jgi:uncharacterized protein (DUF697 family)